MTATRRPEPRALPELTMVGHATVALHAGEGEGATRLLFDPFFVRLVPSAVIGRSAPPISIPTPYRDAQPPRSL